MMTDHEKRELARLTDSYVELVEREKQALAAGNEKHLRHVRSAQAKVYKRIKELDPDSNTAKPGESKTRAATELPSR